MSSASALPSQIETAAPYRPAYNPWVIAFTVTLATFMEILDTSIANVSLPHIAGGLAASVDESTWVLTSYLVANAIVLPMSAWISGLIGRKRFYMTCVALFTVSSLCCGLAPSLGALIFFRVLQGAGGGGLQPSEQSILADTFAPEQFGMAFAIYGMAVVLAPAIGPTLGGYITDTYNWRWIFFINVPLGVISLMLTGRVVEDPPYLKQHISAAGERSMDWGGLVLVALGFGTLQIVLDKGQEDDWLASNFILVLLIIAIVSLTVFTIWELRHRHPVVDLRLLGNSNFAVANLMMFVVGVTLYGATVLLPQYVQQLMGYTAMWAGMVLTPGGFAIMVLMPLVGALTTRVPARWMAMFGFFVSACAFFYMSSIEPGIDFQTAVTYRLLQSVGLAFLFVPINTAAYVGIPQEKSRDVSSMINLARNIGGSVGISMVETILARRAQMHHSRLAEHFNPFNPIMRQGLSEMGARVFHLPATIAGPASRPLYAGIYGALEQQAFATAYIDVIWFMAIACVVMVPFTLLMKRNDPHQAQIGGH